MRSYCSGTAGAASRRPSAELELISSPITKLTWSETKRASSRCISFAKGSHRDKLHYIGSGHARAGGPFGFRKP